MTNRARQCQTASRAEAAIEVAHRGVNPFRVSKGRTMDDQRAGQVIETDIPSRLDRLPWSPFHWLVVVALGVTWILDGLEVTLAGSVAAALQDSPVLHLGSAE